VINLLYCFDSNYNFQAFTSIYSFLNNTKEKLNIYVIHKDESNKKIFPDKILNHKNLSQLNLYKFDRKFTKFPNVKNSHVSEATYYRIFFDSYIEDVNDLKTLVYVDSDMVCISNPFSEIKKYENDLLKSKYIISAKTEDLSDSEKKTIFNNLELTSGKYLNAGFLIIDVAKWTNKNIPSELINKIVEIEDKIIYWDQDVFNSYFDGLYLELPNSLNTDTELESKNLINKNSLILHYYGKTKPWNTKGILNNKSKYYQDSFRLLGLGSYHVTHKRRILSIKQLLYGLVTLRIFNIYKPISFIKEFISSLFR
tara:strand:- start:69 stop:1001 length:933 start_codon:yes stop_codon:yes gene_type:complete